MKISLDKIVVALCAFGAVPGTIVGPVSLITYAFAADEPKDIEAVKCLDGSRSCEREVISFDENEVDPAGFLAKTKKPAAKAPMQLVEDKILDITTPYAQAKDTGCVGVTYPEIGAFGTSFMYEVRDGRLIALLMQRGGELGVMKITRVAVTNGNRKVETGRSRVIPRPSGTHCSMSR